MNNCTFNLQNEESNKILYLNVNEMKITYCNFNNFGSESINVVTNAIDFSYNDVTGSRAFMYIKGVTSQLTFSGNFFHDFDIKNLNNEQIVQIDHNIDEITIENNTFCNINGGNQFGVALDCI